MLFVVSGPSGAGKSTLCARMLALRPSLRMSVSYTTRASRGAERHGEDYFFISMAEFEAMVARGAFAEHAVVHGNLYGTAKETIAEFARNGFDVLFDIDHQGAEQLRSAFSDAVTTMILPPSLALLEQRLRARATDSEEVVRRRMQKALHEMEHALRFDYVVVNETIDGSMARLQAIYDAENVRASRIGAEVLAQIGLRPLR